MPSRTQAARCRYGNQNRRQPSPCSPNKHWQFCVGSGHALLALRTDYVKQLKFIHDTPGIQRVRFHVRTVNDLSSQLDVPVDFVYHTPVRGRPSGRRGEDQGDEEGQTGNYVEVP